MIIGEGFMMREYILYYMNIHTYILMCMCICVTERYVRLRHLGIRAWDSLVLLVDVTLCMTFFLDIRFYSLMHRFSLFCLFCVWGDLHGPDRTGESEEGEGGGAAGGGWWVVGGGL